MRYTHSKPGICGKTASWQGQGGAVCVCIWTASKRKASRGEGRAPLSSLAEWESHWRGSLTRPGCGACVLACEAYIYMYIYRCVCVDYRIGHTPQAWGVRLACVQSSDLCVKFKVVFSTCLYIRKRAVLDRNS